MIFILLEFDINFKFVVTNYYVLNFEFCKIILLKLNMRLFKLIYLLQFKVFK